LGSPYLFGSTEVKQGGLDCSGFVLRAIKLAYGVFLPDEAGLQLAYVQRYGRVWHAGSGSWSPSFLSPGDLIFWTGTYPCSRASPVTHVMVWLGEGRMAGAQGLGQRIGLKGAGVGYYPFTPTRPQGRPGVREPLTLRKQMTLYAYGRLDWKRLKFLYASRPTQEGAMR
jgi:cell wall-associated NlpC family hydrolase